MTGPGEEAWDYVRRAPLPVVLAVSVLLTGVSLGYTAKNAVDRKADVAAAEAKADVAARKAEVAAATDAQALAALERVEKALAELTAQVAVTNVLVRQHIDEAHKAKR